MEAMTNHTSSKKSFLLLIFLSSLTSIFSFDSLQVSEFLEFNQTLISSEQKYEAGFFIPPGSESGKIYFGIWYYNLSDPKTIVWVANRDNFTNSSSVTLKIKNDGGGQVVMMQKSIEIWASKKSSLNVVDPFLQLLDTGNLVVGEANGSVDYIWQSFDYPSDTLLPYQKLGWTQKTGINRQLISWKSTTDPSPGNYSLNLTRIGDPELFMNSRTDTIYRTGPFMGQSLSGIPAMKSYTGLNFTLLNIPSEVYYMFTLTDMSIRSRMVVGPDGVLYRYMWVPEYKYWTLFWTHPEVPCDKYMACGPYGVCDDSQLFGCVCPPGFVPRDSRDVSLRDGTHGCVRKTRLECRTDGFKKMKNMKLPMSGAATVNLGKGLGECERMCKIDCNCTAYANAHVVDDVRTGCVTWTGDLLDMRTFDEGVDDLYIRLAAADLSTNKTKKVKIGIGVSLATFIVAIVASLAWKAKNQPRDRSGTRRDLQLNGTTTPNKDLWLYNKEEDGLELPMYNFKALVVATNNFSDENKLGQGGFGSVFKGVLNEVQEIAIKRLSKESMQGFDQFKNEVNLIAKLQHRNLIKLLGYCVEKEEKMLIYEYLCNRSLDYILFDKERCLILNWKRRFNIICGVAKGLVYLHHDSRIRIIHRDIKASNILLDDDMNPKISDFGMARIFRGDESETNNTRRVVGTYGYMSPEYAMNGVFSIKSDAFSFGVLVLEIVTGKQTRSFCSSHEYFNILGYAWKMWDEEKGAEIIDPSIRDSNRLDEALKCIQVGLLCVQEEPNDRPTMSQVVLMLSSETVTLPQPTLPGFYLGRKPVSETDSNPSQLDESFTINQLSVTMINGR